MIIATLSVLLTGELVAVVHLGLPVAGLPVDVEGEAGGAAHGGQADGAGRARSVASAMVPCEMWGDTRNGIQSEGVNIISR